MKQVDYNRKNSTKRTIAGFVMIFMACMSGYLARATEGQCPDNPPPGKACCGGTAYDPNTSGCCNSDTGLIYDLQSEACCDGVVVYDPTNQFCCGGQIGSLATNQLAADIDASSLLTPLADAINDIPHFSASGLSANGNFSMVTGEECCDTTLGPTGYHVYSGSVSVGGTISANLSPYDFAYNHDFGSDGSVDFNFGLSATVGATPSGAITISGRTGNAECGDCVTVSGNADLGLTITVAGDATITVTVFPDSTWFSNDFSAGIHAEASVDGSVNATGTYSTGGGCSQTGVHDLCYSFGQVTGTINATIKDIPWVGDYSFTYQTTLWDGYNSCMINRNSSANGSLEEFNRFPKMGAFAKSGADVGQQQAAKWLV